MSFRLYYKHSVLVKRFNELNLTAFVSDNLLNIDDPFIHSVLSLQTGLISGSLSGLGLGWFHGCSSVDPNRTKTVLSKNNIPAVSRKAMRQRANVCCKSPIHWKVNERCSLLLTHFEVRRYLPVLLWEQQQPEVPTSYWRLLPRLWCRRECQQNWVLDPVG